MRSRGPLRGVSRTFPLLQNILIRDLLSSTKPQECKYGSRCISSRCALFHPPVWTPDELFRDGKLPACSYGSSCSNKACWYKHPPSWNPSTPQCKLGLKCQRLGCAFRHPAEYIAPTMTSRDASEGMCALHSVSRGLRYLTEVYPGRWECLQGKRCMKPCATHKEKVSSDYLIQGADGLWTCTPGRPCKDHAVYCPHGSSCWNQKCQLVHPLGWKPLQNRFPCRYGLQCDVLGCQAEHPKGFVAPTTGATRAVCTEHGTVRSLHLLDSSKTSGTWSCSTKGGMCRRRCMVHKTLIPADFLEEVAEGKFRCRSGNECPTTDPAAYCGFGLRCVNEKCKLLHPPPRRSPNPLTLGLYKLRCSLHNVFMPSDFLSKTTESGEDWVCHPSLPCDLYAPEMFCVSGAKCENKLCRLVHPVKQ